MIKIAHEPECLIWECKICIQLKMINLIASAALLLLVSYSEALQSNDATIDFSRTNEFLTKHRLTAFPELAFAALKKQMVQPYGKCELSRLEVEKLKVFVSLVDKRPDEKCSIRDHMSWQYDLDKFVGQKYRESGIDQNKLSPIERLLHHFGQKHAQQCHAAYSVAFDRFFRFVQHRDKIDNVAKLASIVMSSYAESNQQLKKQCLGLNNEKVKFLCLVQSTKSFNDEKFAIALRKYLESVAGPEESKVLDRVECKKTGQCAVDTDKVIELLFNRVFNPAWYASIDLSASVGPASYDFDFLDTADWMGATDPKQIELYYYIGLYRFADRVGKWESDSIRRNVIQIIRDESWKEIRTPIHQFSPQTLPSRPLPLRKVDIDSD